MDMHSLVQDALIADDQSREAALQMLLTVIRQVYDEGAEFLKPVEEALPRLVPFLADQDNGNVDGCAISIFRRMNINDATIVCLLALNAEKPNGFVVEALGQVDLSRWTDEIESEIVRSLSFSEAVGAAAYALYGKHYVIKQEATFHALAKTIHSKDWLASFRAIYALSCLTKREDDKLALQLLEEAVYKITPKLRAELTRTLGWATDKAFSILEQTASDPDAEIRAATATSLGRSYLEHKGARELLLALKQDPEEEVQVAALKSLS